MLDLYNTISSEEKSQVESRLERYEAMRTTQSPPLATYQETAFLNDADMVMSFVNLGELFKNVDFSVIFFLCLITIMRGCFERTKCLLYETEKVEQVLDANKWEWENLGTRGSIIGTKWRDLKEF